jgi:transcriptional regulator with XRE-family HTH domain
MNVSDALRTIMSERGATQSAIAGKVGVSQPAIASVLSVGNPQTRVLVSILKALDYKLVAVPTGEELPEGAYVVEARRG